MMAQPFFSDATAAKIAEVRRRAFATSMVAGRPLGETLEVVLLRDSETDGTSVELAPQEVRVSMADRQPSRDQTEAASVGLAGGELRRAAPFDVQPGDRFTLPGERHARIDTVYPDMGPYVRATFLLEA